MRKRDNVCFFDCFFSVSLRKDNEMKIAAAPNERGEEEEDGRGETTTATPERENKAGGKHNKGAGKNRKPNTSREMHTAWWHEEGREGPNVGLGLRYHIFNDVSG